MASVRNNVIANMLGGGWTAILSLAFIPLYIRFMGIEAYGLVGFYVTLQVLFSVLDMGLTTTISRELARLSAFGNKGALEMRNVMRTLEMVYWALASLIVMIVVLAAPWIATSWLDSRQLTPETVQTSVMLMGAALAFRMPYGFYSGGLIGLQRQVLLNYVRVAVETLRSGGSVLVLWLVSPTITAFFIWHAVAGVFGVLLIYAVVWQCMPKSTEVSRFSIPLFRRLWRFGAGMSGIAILSLLLVEMDKIILSKMLPLEEFGYYMLASMVAMGVNLLIVPVFSAIQPRLTQLVASEDKHAVLHLYHKGCQMMTALVMPVALILCLFSEEVLWIWTQDASIAKNSAPLLSLLIIGTAFNAQMNIPYALQLAHGWLKLSIISNMVAVAVLVPALIWMISSYGVIGAASIWAILNIGYVLFNLPIVHAKLLPGEFAQWVIVDFGLPTLTALGVTGIFWAFMPAGLSMMGMFAWIAMALLAGWLSCALAAPALRSLLLRPVSV